MRSRQIRHLLTVLVAAAAAACASSAGVPAGTAAPTRVAVSEIGVDYDLSVRSDAVQSELAAPVDRVWTALLTAYSRIGVEPDIVNPGLRTLGVRRFAGTRIAGRRSVDMVRCALSAGPAVAGGYHVQLEIISTLRPAGENSTRLATEVGAIAMRTDGTSTAPSRCESTGDIERQISAAVSDLLRP